MLLLRKPPLLKNLGSILVTAYVSKPHSQTAATLSGLGSPCSRICLDIKRVIKNIKFKV